MSLLSGAVATISLIVRGIASMNILLVLATERTREIALRMAVGAGPRDIRRQFLAEAMLISLIGGAIGIALGIVGALMVGKFGSLPVALNGQVSRWPRDFRSSPACSSAATRLARPHSWIRSKRCASSSGSGGGEGRKRAHERDLDVHFNVVMCLAES